MTSTIEKEQKQTPLSSFSTSSSASLTSSLVFGSLQGSSQTVEVKMRGGEEPLLVWKTEDQWKMENIFYILLTYAVQNGYVAPLSDFPGSQIQWFQQGDDFVFMIWSLTTDGTEKGTPIPLVTSEYFDSVRDDDPTVLLYKKLYVCLLNPVVLPSFNNKELKMLTNIPDGYTCYNSDQNCLWYRLGEKWLASPQFAEASF